MSIACRLCNGLAPWTRVRSFSSLPIVSEQLINDLSALRPTNVTLRMLMRTGMGGALPVDQKPPKVSSCGVGHNIGSSWVDDAGAGNAGQAHVSWDSWDEEKSHRFRQRQGSGAVGAASAEAARLAEQNDSRHHDATISPVATDEILLQVAAFLLSELPRRYAHRIRELDALPESLRLQKGVIACRKQFVQSMAEVLQFEQTPCHPVMGGQGFAFDSLDDERKFAQMVKRNMDRHAPTLVLMAGALFDYQQQAKLSTEDLADNIGLHDRLDSFQLGRIGTRVLCGQYLELHRGWEGAGTRAAGRIGAGPYVGLINGLASPATVAQYAVQDATTLCEREYGTAPDVVIEGDTEGKFPYIPSHLYYMLFELIKNGMRATVHSHRSYCDTDGSCSFMPYLVALPRMEISIGHSDSNEDVVIKIHDKGGGISRSHLKRLFSYLFTTARPSTISTSDELIRYGKSTPMAGLGYGLPISRAYARYFGGELTVISVEGHSTDAYLHINKLGDAEEPLPYFWEGGQFSSAAALGEETNI